MQTDSPIKDQVPFEVSPMAARLIDKIRRNRISSTEVADCLNKTGALTGVAALNRGHYCVGPVYWTYAFNESNWDLHQQVAQAPEGTIVLVDAFNCHDRALFGALVAKYLILYRQVAGIVVQGNLRDIPHLYKENWPVWCSGTNPIGCFNSPNETPLNLDLVKDQQEFYQGAIAICDDTGVVVVPQASQTEDFNQRLDWIEEQEDIWFDCIDRRKWDTFETVCLQKYLNSPAMPDQPSR